MHCNTTQFSRSPTSHTHTHTQTSSRMKDQIKSRMEFLLQMELEERSVGQSTARQPVSLSTSTAGKAGLAGHTSLSSTTASAGSRRGSSREETRAEMLFNVDRGTYMYMCVQVCKFSCDMYVHMCQGIPLSRKLFTYMYLHVP